jgi:hypothetical protein
MAAGRQASEWRSSMVTTKPKIGEEFESICEEFRLFTKDEALSVVEYFLHCKGIVTYMGFVAVNVFDLSYLNSFFSIIYQLLHSGENFLFSESSTQIHIQQANHLYKFADSVTNALVFHRTQPLSFPAPEPCVGHKKRSFPT